MNDKKPIYKRVWFWIVVIILVLFIGSGYIIMHDLNVQEQHESIRYCEVDSDCVDQSYQEPTCGTVNSCFNKNKRPSSYISSMIFPSNAACEPMEFTCCKCENKKCVTHGGPEWKLKEICS